VANPFSSIDSNPQPGVLWRVRRVLGRAWLRLFGWQIEGGNPSVQKAVVIAYPHTTNWDLPFMLAIAWALGLNVGWLGKKSLFKPAFGWFMRGVGGIAVDRSRSTRLVDAIVAAIEPRQELLLVIPPEGTRSRSGHWKSGFYWVAVGAGIPIVLGFLDYTRRCGGLGEVFEPSGDIAADMKDIRTFYSGIEGKFPGKQGEILLEEGSG